MSEFSLKSQTVERIKLIGQGLGGVVVGKVLAIEKHPNADRLSLAQVDIGRQAPLKLVFGQMAKIEVGNQLPVAVAPIKLPTGIEVKAADIRGVKSEGMLCLNSELGLSDRDEVMFFDSRVAPGVSIVDALKLNDYLLEIEVTSNRPDLMSVVGLAREAQAVLDIKSTIKIPEPKLDFKQEIGLTVKVEESKLCPRYNAVVMTDIKVGPSPLWLQLRLMTAGLRPINNLVDITNYVLLEYGRPLHVFDYDQLAGAQIMVRRARKGERLLALDGKIYELSTRQLVIADAKEPVAIGGVMGGEESAAHEQTKTIVFESATFDPVLIRKTARELNLHSASSDLFEKNLHPESTFVGILRAIELTQQLAGGKVASPIIDIYAKDYQPTQIEFDPANIERYLGVVIKPQAIKKILTNLGFEVSGTNKLKVTVPWYRADDVTAEHDLFEEVARVYGYDNLPVTLPMGEIPVEPADLNFYWEDVIKDRLVGLGFSEVYNYSMLSGKLLEPLGFSPARAIKIDNPLNEDFEYLRLTLIPQLLINVASNLNNFSQQKIFELSNVYLTTKSVDLPREESRLTGAVIEPEGKIFALTKGVGEFLLEKMGITDFEFRVTDQNCPIWQPNMCLDIYRGKDFLGQLGIIETSISETFGIDQAVGVFDFNFSRLIANAKTQAAFKPIPEFPSITRDLAILVNQDVTWHQINDLVWQTDDLIVAVNYLSTYTDKSIGTNKKSLAWRIVFRAPDRTLKSEEVDQIMEQLTAKLKKEFAATVR